MVVLKSKRKRESATDISDMIEGRQFDKNSKNPALIERPYSRSAMSLLVIMARCAGANGLELKQASPQLDGVSPYRIN